MPFALLLKLLFLYKTISNTNFKAPFASLLLALKRLCIKIADANVMNLCQREHLFVAIMMAKRGGKD